MSCSTWGGREMFHNKNMIQKISLDFMERHLIIYRQRWNPFLNVIKCFVLYLLTAPTPGSLFAMATHSFSTRSSVESWISFKTFLFYLSIPLLFLFWLFPEAVECCLEDKLFYPVWYSIIFIAHNIFCIQTQPCL